jgi:predicted kinase
LSATYIRIDSIEQGIENSVLNVDSAEDAGYLAAYKVAVDNLVNGQTVVCDSVNPIELTRKDWRSVAENTGCVFTEIEVVCSDKDERRARLLVREAANPGRVEGLINREYEAWTCAIAVIDTAGVTLETSLTEVLALVK